MSSCSTVSQPGAVVTSYSTSTFTTEAISTSPGATITSQSLVTSCATPSASGADPVCVTSTSAFPTVLPGSTYTVTSTGQSVVPVYSTAPGSVQTVCQAVPTSSSPPPSSSASPAPTTSSASPTTQVAAAPSSTTTFVTTTLTSVAGAASSPASSSFVRSTTTLPVDPQSAAVSSGSSSSSELRLSTSYRVVFVTSTDASGRTAVWSSSVPTILNSPASSGSSTNTGAIAGGVVGGVAALALAAIVFWLLRKKGLFRRNEEELDDEAWAPRPHSDFYAGPLGAGGGGTGSGDEKLEAMSENDHAVDAATLERHRSWYNSLGGHDGSPEMEEAYGGMAPQGAAASGPNGYPAAGYEGGGAAPTGSMDTLAMGGAAAGQPPRRSMSNRVSLYSASSHSHDAQLGYPPHNPYNAPLPPVPDPRLSLHHGYFQNFPAPNDSYAEELAAIAAAGGAHRSNSPPFFQRPRSASPPHSPPRDQSVSRQPSIQGLALPAHLRSEYGSRPPLEALQSDRTRESSSSTLYPSRAQTNDSMSSSSSPQSHNIGLPSPRSGTFGSGLTPPSTAAPSPAAQSSPAGPKTAPLAALPVPSIERLKADNPQRPQRPGFNRNGSSESFIVPTQWLGARIANADDTPSLNGTETDRATIADAGESVDSLGLAKGEIAQAEVVVDRR
ncbi:hypothetical protein JCM10213_004045 [Rhodosporidiobolus nylandii]